MAKNRPLEEIAASICFCFVVVAWTAAAITRGDRAGPDDGRLEVLEEKVSSLEAAHARCSRPAAEGWNATLPERAAEVEKKDDVPPRETEEKAEADRLEARWRHWKKVNAHLRAPLAQPAAEVAEIETTTWGGLLKRPGKREPD